MRLGPVLAEPCVDNEGHVELEGVLHDVLHESQCLLALLFRDLEQQLVVDLEDEAGPKPAVPERRQRGRALPS